MRLKTQNQTWQWCEPVIMGVLNVTPDSFSDGGAHNTVDAAVTHALRMAEAGAQIIDIGGESTRPGAEPVPVAQELARVIPVIERIAAQSKVIISIDTSKPEVMTAACAAGAQIINDVRALQAPGALEAAKASGAAVCLMHMQGEPRVMQDNPQYRDVVAEVRDFLTQRVRACEAAGIAFERLMLDPGFGFGKSLTHNMQLLAGLGEISTLGLPLLVGVSRKSMFKALLGLKDPADRVNASVAAAVIAVRAGANVVRTHDVAATREAVAVAAAVNNVYRDLGHG